MFILRIYKLGKLKDFEERYMMPKYIDSLKLSNILSIIHKYINPLINYHILHLIEDLKEYLNAKIHPITKNQILLLINKLLRKRKIDNNFITIYKVLISFDIFTDEKMKNIKERIKSNDE